MPRIIDSIAAPEGTLMLTNVDAILADDDGVVTVSRSTLESALQAAQLREEREAEVRARLAAGELGLDIYEMRRKLEQLGLVYADASAKSDRSSE